MTNKAFAPAKVNLCLHVVGQRPDGYHLLDSLVAFATVGDHVVVAPADRTSLVVTGPMAAGVPADPTNLCWRAADGFDMPVAIRLEKHLPAAAGIGGGSSDAAAVLRAMTALTGRAPDFDPVLLGADVPVCMVARAARMSGIGDMVEPADMPTLHAVLINPRRAVETAPVFRALASKNNVPMAPLPSGDADSWIAWLAEQRNDLQAPAEMLEPAITECLAVLSGSRLARMSGSGATCFGLYDSVEEAETAAKDIAKARPDWWVAPCQLA